MKKLIVIMQTIMRQIASIFQEFSATLDNVNTAWREGKALENFQLTFNDDHERDENPSVSVLPLETDDRSHQVEVVIVTEGIPSRLSLFRIKRSQDNANRRFGTHLVTRIVHQPSRTKEQQSARQDIRVMLTRPDK
jgi:hypothetical protein